jgi:alanyl-tRNA synthetase
LTQLQLAVTISKTVFNNLERFDIVKAKEIRARFLQFYADKSHQVVSSSTLVPQDDPTLIFTNAGMNQFKAVFLGIEKRDYVRATSCQKCMRVSGKHNDLDEVGRDARHHTFFEMLGNWSFGDYYKKESLEWGWEFLTKEMGLSTDNIWASVYKDDDEAYNIFKDNLSLPEERIVRLGDLDKGDDENFWSMGDTGPCGPCAEIHVDQGVEMTCNHPKGCALGVCDCDRWLEIWNHVFMEFNRDENGTLNPLPMKSVDTGMGLERLVAVAQGVKSNFDCDLFTPLIKYVSELSGKKPEGDDKIAMQVIADHARAVCFAVTDGATPSNDGRGYVVRRILRRAAKFGRNLELKDPFLWKVAELVISEMGEAYPEIIERKDQVLKTIRKEEERFNLTLDRGLQQYADIRKKMQAENRTEISGEEAFMLHDTYGFPVDLTAVVAEDDKLTVDSAGFKVCMEKQRASSGKERKFMAGVGAWEAVDQMTKSSFVGYDKLVVESTVIAVRKAGDNSAQLIFTETPFYAESGGQTGDTGRVTFADGTVLEIMTTATDEAGNASVVSVDADQLIAKCKTNAKVKLEVSGKRPVIMRHHTATHLLQSALREVLGDHVTQAGSEVTAEKLRFDFHHDQAVSQAELAHVERIVNREILANREVQIHNDVPIDQAKEQGATALFGEKYGDTVRIIEIAGLNETVFSLELCGGTHVKRSGDIGPFRITGESSCAAGIRRIEAVAGEIALMMIEDERDILKAVKVVLNQRGNPAELIANLKAEKDALTKELKQAKQASAAGGLEELLGNAIDLNDFKFLTAEVDADDRDSFMQLGDRAVEKLGSSIAVLVAEWEGKYKILVAVSDDLVKAKRYHAGNLVKEIAGKVGGRGGGRPNAAQAGLPDSDAARKALELASDIVTNWQ